jgi:hypothetical protein
MRARAVAFSAFHHGGRAVWGARAGDGKARRASPPVSVPVPDRAAVRGGMMRRYLSAYEGVISPVDSACAYDWSGRLPFGGDSLAHRWPLSAPQPPLHSLATR